MDNSPGAVLKKYWGHTAFRGSQEAIIKQAMEGNDVAAMLPTGGGKSLCYQIPGFLLPGVCLVVSPLLALMEDQVASLNSRGIRALSLSGPLPEEELTRLLDNVEFGRYKFLYLSPERLQQDIVISRIKNLPVNLIAVDEAHCISQWGFDFRPAYLKCGVLRELHPDVPCMALTATATGQVIEDICKLLNLKAPALFRDSVLRPNITYTVVQTEDKRYRLRRLLDRHPGSAIIYVSTRRATARVSEFLERSGYSSSPFHGGLEAGIKSKRLMDWQSGKVRIMVATNAFGMGIDKADVRLVAHYNVPETIEHYFQEAGRAGRDGRPALAALILGPGDLEQARDQYLKNLPSIPVLLNTYRKLNSFFGIPYGELPESPFPIKLTEFCDTYSLDHGLTYNALELLDRQGVISLSQVFWEKTQIRFICGKSDLWQYLGTYADIQPVVRTLLRTYGGMFDFETPVKLDAISRKSGVPKSRILSYLKQMEKDKMIHMEIAEGDLQVRFLLPREDDKTIYRFSKQVETRLEVKRKKVRQMAAYLENDRQCRQQQLLAYFGEDGSPQCGLCDVCSGNTPPAADDLTVLRARILGTLQGGPKTSRQILEEGDFPETPALTCLQSLLHEGILTLGAENQYYIS